MIQNYALEQKILALKLQKSELVKVKTNIELNIKDIGYSKNRAYSLRNTERELTEEETAKIKEREELVKEKLKVDGEIIVLNDQLRDLFRQEDAEINKQLIEIFRETFTPAQMSEMRKEAERRVKGQPPFRLSFSVKDSISNAEDATRFKKLAESQLEKMKEFRVLLTKVVNEGCAKFDQTEFMRVISPLNRLITPLDELAKIKRKHFV